jgi:RNA polymerase sigma-70 factor (ECF subfamily)
LGVAPGDIEDVCQEVFIVVHRRLDGFEHRSSVRTWLHGICVRVASDYRRKRRTKPEPVELVEHDGEVAATQVERLAEQEARELLDALLDRLDENKRAVFVLYEIEQVPMQEVAEAVGCPLQTAYSRLHAARREISAAIEELHNRRTP